VSLVPGLWEEGDKGKGNGLKREISAKLAAPFAGGESRLDQLERETRT